MGSGAELVLRPSHHIVQAVRAAEHVEHLSTAASNSNMLHLKKRDQGGPRITLFKVAHSQSSPTSCGLFQDSENQGQRALSLVVVSP